EQARGLEVDFRTDFFSLGVVLYEVLSGHHPFEGETPSDTFAALLTSDAPPLTKSSNSISIELERIINKALSKDRTARYQSARDFLSDLESLRSRLKLMYGSSPSFEDVLVRGTRRAENVSFIRSSFFQAVDKGKQIVQSSRFYKAAALLALVMIAAWIVSVRFQSAQNDQGGIRGIAVLPLAIESDGQDAEFLSDGLSEALINDLSRLPDVKVIARSSVYRYKGKEIDVQEVSRVLGVQAILMGRIVQQGEKLSISIELIDARSNIYLLKERFEATTDTILEVQGRIARRASERLHIELNPEQKQLLSKQHTRSAEAYQLYLKGRYHWNRSTEADLRKAIDLFNEAIVADPDYALAYAGLAETYSSLAANYVPPSHVIPIVKAYAQKAIALDDTLPDTHYARGLNEFLFEWDWPEAERDFKRTLELNPSHANALTSYAGLLRTKGEMNEAVTVMQRALEIDPLSMRIRMNLGLTYYYFRKYDEAIAQFQVALQMDPNFFFSYVNIGRAYLQKKQPLEAIGFLEKARDLSEGDPQALAPLARAYAASGRKREAQEILDRIVRVSKQSYIRPHEVGMIYASLGQKEQALSWLEKAYQDRSAWLLTVKLDPELDGLQPDPKFKDLLSRIGPSS
ncbi:MAG TPA: tetratricopeptide repeat protein, partial [Blastocatellia bacterium]|nr:tetratricopeptide repeat protein [Blastocatellia bacterium]